MLRENGKKTEKKDEKIAAVILNLSLPHFFTKYRIFRASKFKRIFRTAAVDTNERRATWSRDVESDDTKNGQFSPPPLSIQCFDPPPPIYSVFWPPPPYLFSVLTPHQQVCRDTPLLYRANGGRALLTIDTRHIGAAVRRHITARRSHWPLQTRTPDTGTVAHRRLARHRTCHRLALYHASLVAVTGAGTVVGVELGAQRVPFAPVDAAVRRAGLGGGRVRVAVLASVDDAAGIAGRHVLALPTQRVLDVAAFVAQRALALDTGQQALAGAGAVVGAAVGVLLPHRERPVLV